MDHIWIWFADNGNIRKWQSEPFEEGTEFVPASRLEAREAEIARLREQVADLEARKAEVHALHERPERNRDMWKGQVERQSAEMEKMREALGKVLRSLDAEASYHRCSCPSPCEDYHVYPGPCGTRNAEAFRNIAGLARAALGESR